MKAAAPKRDAPAADQSLSNTTKTSLPRRAPEGPSWRGTLVPVLSGSLVPVRIRSIYNNFSGSGEIIKNYLALQGLRPAAHGAPVSDSVVLPAPQKAQEIFCTGNTETSHAPPPPTGAGLARRGAMISHKIGFLQCKFFI